MGTYGQFKILPYVVKESKFLLDKNKNVTDKFNKNHAGMIVEALRENSKTFVMRETAKNLENALNEAITGENSQKYEKLVKKIIDGLIEGKEIQSLWNSGVIQQRRGSITLKKTVATLPKYEEEVKRVASIISKQQTTIDDIDEAISVINGSLNKIRGDIFENLLADLLNISKDISLDLANAGVEDLKKIMKNNLERYSGGAIKVIDKSNKSSSKVLTSQKETLEIEIDNESIKVAGSLGKADVSVNGLFNPIGISAKNYRGAGSTISLLNGANVAGLIVQWPGADDDMKNLALNGLSAISIYEEQFELMKQIFLIQGLMGTESEDIKSQLLIVNTNRVNKPILVFSVYDLLFNDKSYALEGDFSKTVLAPVEDLPRDIKKFMTFINNTKISIRTQLKISQLQKAYNNS